MPERICGARIIIVEVKTSHEEKEVGHRMVIECPFCNVHEQSIFLGQDSLKTQSEAVSSVPQKIREVCPVIKKFKRLKDERKQSQANSVVILNPEEYYSLR